MDGAQFYAVRLVKGGPRVPCKIWYGGPIDPLTGEEMDRSPRWQVWLSGELQDDISNVILHFEPDGTPIVKGEEIDAVEHEYLLQLREYAVTYDATLPEAEPTKPVDLRKMAPIRPPR